MEIVPRPRRSVSQVSMYCFFDSSHMHSELEAPLGCISLIEKQVGTGAYIPVIFGGCFFLYYGLR